MNEVLTGLAFFSLISAPVILASLCYSRIPLDRVRGTFSMRYRPYGPNRGKQKVA